MREDYEYVRRGTCNLFCAFVPQTGERQMRITAQRTARDFAEMLRVLVDEWYPDAERVRLVLDNLNTHTGAAVYATFPPAEARRILRKVEWHYTPKHGSWLNMVEMEWSVLTRQCIGRHIGDMPTLAQEVAAWERERNAAKATVEWRFTTDEARRKLARLYPS